jgi:RHS repeat-associated protein
LTRQIENVLSEDPYNEADGIKVQTRYETGNPYSYQLSSNPYRTMSEAEMGWTRSKSINTGKHGETETFSGASLPAPWGTNVSSTGKVQTDIDGERTLVTDQSGKQRISKTNALGQLLNVWEVKDADADTEGIAFGSLSLNALKTSYQYDTLNNLITVNQGVQTRTFAYNSLSRLKSANNPESGLISYKYDENGNLTSKTDARSITTTYIYDVLNRVKNRNYSDNTTPNVAYTYDSGTNAKGKLTKVTNGTSTTEYTNFDILGRVLNHKQRTDNNDYTTAYTYNLSGALIEETYPSGRVVKNTLDQDGDLQQVQSSKSSGTFQNYANAFTYTSAGAVSSMRLGNGKFENTTFNSRLQPIQIGLGSSASSQNLLKLNFDYGGIDNNGNVKSQQITVQQGNPTALVLNQNYVYDSLNRLKSAEEKDVNNAVVWKQTYVFDRYGNRNWDVSNTTTLPQNFNANISNPAVNVADNRFTTGQGYVYDLSGNIIQDAEGRTFAYDAENKQKQVSNANNPNIGTYFFDGDGKRIKKISPTETTIFVYDAGGKLVAEYSTQQADTPKINYTTNDHLGSPRITTDQNGQAISRTDYMPYGEEIASTQRTANLGYTVQDSVKQGFTGYIKDDETGLDYAQARMYKNSLGRFTSTDPIIMAPERAVDPQQINLYVYTRNNPLNYVDLNGEIINEPTSFANEEEKKRYEKWKEKFLSTEEGRKMWNKYADDKGFTLDISITDRGSDQQNGGAKVGDYKFDKDGNFTGASMTLGNNLENGVPNSDYPVGSSLTDVDGLKKAASKIAHEFGHLEQFRAIGHRFFEQQQIIGEYNARQTELTNNNATVEQRSSDSKLANLDGKFVNKFGRSMEQMRVQREWAADMYAIPIIRQVLGKSASGSTNNAMKVLETFRRQ